MQVIVFALQILVTVGIVVAAVVWGPNIVRTTLASRFWFYAKVGEMQALAIERFGEFDRMFISVKGIRYEEFRGYCNSRNFMHLRDNGLLPQEYFVFQEYDRPSRPADLTEEEQQNPERVEQRRVAVTAYEGRLRLFNALAVYLEGLMRDYRNAEPRVPFILLHADRTDRNQPVHIGRPWEVQPKYFAETREQERLTAYLGLNVRAVHVPKEVGKKEKEELEKKEEGQEKKVEAQGKKEEEMEEKEEKSKRKTSTFFVPDVTDKRGVKTRASFSLILQVHGPYEAIYNVDYYVHTLLNQVVPCYREAVAGESWQPVEDADAGDAAAVVTATAMQQTIGDEVRRRLKLWKADGTWWNRDTSDGKDILRFPKDNDGPLAWVYRNTGVYTHDVVVQDVEAPDLEETIQSITKERFGARAKVEKAKGEKRKLELEGEGRAYAEQKRIEALSAYKKVSEETGIAPTEVLRQDTLAKVAEKAEPMIMTSGGIGGLNEFVAGAQMVSDAVKAKPSRSKPKSESEPPPDKQRGTSPTKPKGGEE
jgi:hypothetical protein